jgi:tetraacyldisaccharide 4'-kinase
MADPRGVEQLWYGTDYASAFARTLLTPVSLLYGGAVGARDAFYEAGWLRSHRAPISVVSVGNLTVGGTGKTPIAAWIAASLTARGANPAIVLRGYGADEPLVHRTLNRSVPVIVGADRLAAVERAAADGADIAVLDDGFQHRRIERDVDLVLVSADQWTNDARLLPAGPWREPLHAVRRASLIIVTCKAAPDDRVDRVHDRLATVAPLVPRVSVRLVPLDFVNVLDPTEAHALSAIAGVRVGAIVSIGDPSAFIAQMTALGPRFDARVDARVFPDHHAFSDRDVAHAARDLKHVDVVLCTLKDAVKLGARWPRLGPPLWYVSQDVHVDRGVGGLDSVLDGVVRARTQRTPFPIAG